MGKKRLTIDLERELHKRAKKLAAETGRSMADIFRELIGEWTDEEEQRLQQVEQELHRRAKKMAAETGRSYNDVFRELHGKM